MTVTPTGMPTGQPTDRRLADRLLSSDFNPERELRSRRPLPTAWARLLAAGGLLAVVLIVGSATLAALRASDWEKPRPELDMGAAWALAATAGGGVAWCVLGVLNARRAGLRNVVHWSVAPLVVALQAGSWFAVDRMVDSDRTRAWAAWVGGVLLLHLLLTSMYRATAGEVGDIDAHFSLVAWLPLLGGVVAVLAVYEPGAVYGLPMVAAVSLWLVVESYQAMAGWDRECRTRITGVDASAKSVAVEFEQAVQERAAREKQGGSERTGFHHTMLPRAMVLAALLLGLSLPAWVLLLERRGHMTVTGLDVTVDAAAGRLLAVLGVGAVATYAVGGMWWAVAAALNAANSSNWSVAPWAAPAGYAVSLATVIAMARLSERFDDDTATVVVLLGVFVLIAAHFAVLRAYRHTADAMGGASGPWTRVILLPMVAVGIAVPMGFLANYLADDVFEVIAHVGWVLLLAAYSASLYPAMESFDRACRGRLLLHVQFSGVPEFLKRPESTTDTES